VSAPQRLFPQADLPTKQQWSPSVGACTLQSYRAFSNAYVSWFTLTQAAATVTEIGTTWSGPLFTDAPSGRRTAKLKPEHRTGSNQHGGRGGGCKSSRSPFSVKSRHARRKRSCPLYPRKRTLRGSVWMSA